MNEKKTGEIYLAGRHFSIIEDDPVEWDNAAMGRSSDKTGRILINPNMSEDIKAETLLHEIIHLIVGINSLDNKELNESCVSILSSNLFGVLRDNKKVAERISGRERAEK